MSYSVYLQKFASGEPAYAPWELVASVLQRYGQLVSRGDRAEFIPDSEDLCEVGFLSGNPDLGLDNVGFERPVSGDRLKQVIFELLGVEGMCYFEQDVSYVLARSDVTNSLPEGLRELCATGKCTVISSSEEITL